MLTRDNLRPRSVRARRIIALAAALALFFCVLTTAGLAETKTKAEQAKEQADLAVAAMQAGDFKKASACFAKAAALQPKEPAFHIGSGDSLLALGEFKKAQTAYDKALKLAPDDVAALCGRGEALLWQKKNDPALEAFRKAAAAEPTAFRAQYGIANAETALKHNEAALAALGECLRLDPESLEARHARGYLLCLVERFDEALADLDPVVLASPDNPTYLQSRSIALRNLYLCDEALYDIERAVALAPKEATYYRTLGHALYFAGRYGEAMAAYQRGVDLAPKGEKASYEYALKTMRSEIDDYDGDAEAAEEEFGRRKESGVLMEPRTAPPVPSPRVDPASLDAGEQIKLAEQKSHYSVNDYAGALVCYQRAIAAGADDYDVFFQRANTLYILDRYDDAAKAYAAALEKLPKDYPYRKQEEANCENDRAYCYFILGRYEQALKAVDRALALYPDGIYVYAPTRNEILVALGREDEVDKEHDDYYIETNCPDMDEFEEDTEAMNAYYDELYDPDDPEALNCPGEDD